MAKNGDQDSPREHYEEQLDQPGDADGFLQSSVNGGGIPQLTPLNSGQRGASNSMDQGREQPQTLMQQQPDTSRGKKRKQQQCAPDSHSPEIRQTIPEKLVRKRQCDKRYRDRIRLEKQQTKADLEKLRTEYGQIKDECWELKSEVKKLKAENGQLRQECQEMKSYVVKLEAEAHGSGPPQSSTSGFQHVGPSVQPSNINPFDDWSHNWDNGVDEHFTVEGICIRSHEMLENEDRQLMPQRFSMGDHAPINMPEDGFQNEDMQLNKSHEVLENEVMQLMPQLSSMGGHASMNMPDDRYTFYPDILSPMSRSHEMLWTEDMQFISRLFSMEGHEDGYTFPPYIPSPKPNFDEERSHTGKIIIGWLKIRAVIKWGSVRKLAERHRLLS